MIAIPKIDLHIHDKCNLKCDGCNHFSNYNIANLSTTENIKVWVTDWSTVINPITVQVLGGEPLLNKDIIALLDVIKSNFSQSKLVLFTNGLLLYNHTELIEYCIKNNIKIIVSIHSNDEKYLKLLREQLSIFDWKSAKLLFKSNFRSEFIINGLVIELRSMLDWWYKNYRGNGVNMLPHVEDNPHKSWDKCVSKHSIQLYNNQLWKCPVITYLKPTLEKFKILDKAEWQQYLQYKPLSLPATDKDVFDFVSKEVESICGMCPSNPEKIYNKEIYNMKVE